MDWNTVLLVPARESLRQVSTFVLNVASVIVVLLIGWLIAKVIETIVVKALKAVKLDTISDRFEVDTILAKGGIKISLSELVGAVCYWIIILVTFLVAANATGLTVAADLLNRVVLYVPNIVAAVFILILGIFGATLLNNVVQTAAANAGIAQSRLLGKVTEIVIIVFTAMIALEQLNMAMKTIDLVISIVLGSLGLGVAIAFGLGCKDIVGKFVNELVENVKRK